MKVPLRVLFILEDASVLMIHFWFLGAQVGRIRSPKLVALKIRSSGTIIGVCVWQTSPAFRMKGVQICLRHENRCFGAVSGQLRQADLGVQL